MISLIKRNLILFFFIFPIGLYSVPNSIVNLIAGAYVNKGASLLPSLQNSPGNNSVVNSSAIASEIVVSSSSEIVDNGSMVINGDFICSGSTMTITLPTDISQLQILNGVVTIAMPVGGTFQIFVGETLQPIPAEIILDYSNSSNVFTIDSLALTVSGSFELSSSVDLSVNGALSVVGTESSSTTIFSNSSLRVGKNILFESSVVSNCGTITSIDGDIEISKNVGINGIYSSGTISASVNKSLTFANNSSATSYGVFIESGIIEAGTITFLNNAGSDACAGSFINGAIYTNNFNMIMDCSVSNQSSLINTSIYEYVDHSTLLASSQINIQNASCRVGGGSLTIIGAISFSGNDVAITVESLANITTTNIFVLDLPIGGILTINGTPYQGTIPGLVVTNGQWINSLMINGALSATTFNIAGSVRTGKELIISENITINSGALIVLTGTETFTVGGDVALSSGAILSVGINLTTFSIAGNITGSGSVTINSALNMSGSITASAITTNAEIVINGGVVAGTISVNEGTLQVNNQLITSGNIEVLGTLTVLTGADTFTAGGNIALSSGAVLSVGTSIIFSIAGNITGSGNVTINSGLNMSGSITASTLTTSVTILVNGGVTTAGTVSINEGTLFVYGTGLNVTSGDILVNAAAGLNVGSGGTSIHAAGSMTFSDDSLGLYSGQVTIDSGDFIMGTNATTFEISGGGISLGGSGVMTLNSSGTMSAGIVAKSLTIGDNVAMGAEGDVNVTGGSVLIGSEAVLTVGTFSYDGNTTFGTSFVNNGTLATSGGVGIEGARNSSDSAVITGIINAGGSLSILNNQCGITESSAILISGNLSGVDVRINNNNYIAINGSAIRCSNNNITATGLLEIYGNNSAAGGTTVFIDGTSVVSAGSTVIISDNNAIGGSSVGVYFAGTLTTPGPITMNNNVGTAFGTRIASEGAVATDGFFTIIIDDAANQRFNSSAVTIKRTDGTTDVPYSSFAVIIGGVFYDAYDDIPNSRVVLAVGNQS